MAVVLSFDANTYLAKNRDVQQAVNNQTISSAIEHYRMFGQFEDRDAYLTDGPDTITFNTSEYSEANPDVAGAVSSGAVLSHIDHFLAFGVTEGRSPNSAIFTGVFDEATYLSNNSDVQSAVDSGAFASGFEHWLAFGAGESRTAQTTTGDEITGDPSGSSGSTFTLTENPDGLTGTAGGDTFVASETTLSSADVIDGAGGTDTLRYASSGTVAVNESGFTASNIETVQVTADNTGGTTFDLTGTTGVTSVINNNSSQNLTFTGATGIVPVTLTSVSGGDTTVTYQDSVLSGASDTQTLNLNDVTSNAGAAVSTVNIGDTSGDGLETLNVVTSGSASMLTDLVTAAPTVNVSGDQDLSIANQLNGATTVDANSFTGALSVVLESNGTATDVVVTGGTGNDTADFSDGFESGDSFDGGDGTDTLGLTNTLATGTPGGSLTNVEQLSVSDAGSGTLDMDNFSGITKVIYDAGVTANGTATVDDAVTGLEVEVDVANLVAADGTLVVDLKTDGSSDALTITLDDIGAGEGLASVSAEDAETLTISADDDTTDGTGTVTIASLTATDATTLNLSGDAAVTITDTSDPTTPVLATLDASGMTDGLTLSGTNFSASGATLTFGSGNDTYTVATSAGADSITLGGGNDVVAYSAIAQSSGSKVDTITDFTAGTDDIDLTDVGGTDAGIVASSQFVGVFSSFGAAQGALTAGDGTEEAVFDSSTSTLWMDVNDDGTLNANDLQVILTGVTSIAATDLNIGGVGVTYTANTVGFNTATASQSTENNAVTTENDTINATAAQTVGATIDGLLGSDTLNLTDTSGTNTADLDDAATDIENVETVTLAAGIAQVNLLAADLAANAAGEIATITGTSGTAQTLNFEEQDAVDLTDTTNTNVETLAVVDTGGDAETLTIDADNLTNVTDIDIDAADAGTADTLILASGTYDFSAIDLAFGDVGVNNILDLKTDGDGNRTVTVDAADLTNVGVINGEDNAGDTTTITLNDTDDLTGVDINDVDAFNFGDFTLAVDNAKTLAGIAALTGGNGTATELELDANEDYDFSDDLAMTGVQILDLDQTASKDITVEVADLADVVTIQDSNNDNNNDLLIEDGGDLTGTTVAGGLDEVKFDQDVGGDTSLTINETFLATTIGTLSGDGAGADTVIVNASATTSDIDASKITTADLASMTLNDGSGNNTITVSGFGAVTNITIVDLANGGNDTVALTPGVAINQGDLNDVTINNFTAGTGGVNSDIFDFTFNGGNNIAGFQGGVTGNTAAGGADFAIALSGGNHTVADLTDVADAGTVETAIRAAVDVTGLSDNDDLLVAIGNTANTSVGLYAVDVADAADGAAEEMMDISLIATLNGVDVDDLVSANLI